MRPTRDQHQPISYIFAIFLSLFVTGLFPNSAAAQVSSGTWSATASMASARSGASSVLLQDGRVLITGGTDASVLSQALSCIADHSRPQIPCCWRAAITLRSL
jgi:hypothetical protein